jgi:hypothetical protein
MRGVSIVVIRWKNGVFRGSKPCAQCTAMLKRMYVKTIIYSEDHGGLTCEKVSGLTSTHLSYARRFCSLYC